MVGIIDQLILNVDSIILLFVQGSFGKFSVAVEILWRLMFIIFIAWFGYKVIISGKFSANDLVVNIMKIIIILAVATQWDTFFLIVYNLVTDLPSEIAGSLIQAASDSLGDSSVNSIDNANIGLSLYYDRSLTITEHVLEGASWYDFGIYLYAGAITLVALIFSSYAAMLIIISKLSVAILLAVGPVFILMLMFKNTQSLFEGWLRTLLNYALLPIFVYAVLAFFLILAEMPLQNLENNASVNAALLTAMAPFLFISVVGIMIMHMTMNKAASITGGISLSTMGAGGWLARKGMGLAQKAPAGALRGSVLAQGAARHPIKTTNAARAKISESIRKTRGF